MRTLGLASASVVAASLLATVLVADAVTALDRYYQDVRENARTGARILEVVETVRLHRAEGQPVILDERLDRMSLGPGAGIVLRVLRLALNLEGIPTQEMWLGEQRPDEVVPGQFVVLAARSKPQFTAEAVAALGLRTPTGEPARAHSQASRYGLYQFGTGTVEPRKSRASGTRGNDAQDRSSVQGQPTQKKTASSTSAATSGR